MERLKRLFDMRTLLLVVVASLSVGFIGLALNERSTCQSRQRSYDGLVRYTAFLGEEFHATPEQIAQGTKDFRRVMGPKPSC